MATHNLPLLLLSFLLLRSSSAATAVKSAYWFPEGGLPASSINSTLFTHLFCAFADLDPATNKATISSSNAAAFSSFTSTVKKNNPSVSTLLSIGGGRANKTAFASMASRASSRSSFISSSIQLARSNSFLGLDLDWEYPSTTSEMANFGTLLTEWRAAVARDATSSGRPALLLTAAVYVSSSISWPTYRAYPVDSITRSLDWINVMSYDYYSPSWKTDTTSEHAALYDPSGEVSTSGGIEDWIAAGVGGGQIATGLPFYGYAWRLADPAKNGIGAAATGVAAGVAGVDKDDGSISYGGILAFRKNTGAAAVYNATVGANYCYSGTTWIGYDDVEAVAAKVTYAKGKGLLGYFAWSVSADSNWTLSRRALSTWGAELSANIKNAIDKSI